MLSDAWGADAEHVAVFTCPVNPVLATDGRPIVGCGRSFAAERDPDDGWVDCPHCGLMFDPDHPENAMQP